jgi:hypothetical protein
METAVFPAIMCTAYKTITGKLAWCFMLVIPATQEAGGSGVPSPPGLHSEFTTNQQAPSQTAKEEKKKKLYKGL